MGSEFLDLTLDHREASRAKKKFRPVIRQFGRLTKFSAEELEALLIIHYKLTKKQPMDRKYFKRLMFKMFDFHNDVLMDRIFSAFDRSNSLVITMDSWIIGMSIYIRGSLQEKIRFCFSVYDLMGDGYIKREQMFQALKHSIKTSIDEDPEELVKDMIDFLMKRMDHDRDGRLSFEDYRMSVMENPYLLEVLGYCLPPRPAVYKFMTTFTELVSTMHTRDPIRAAKPFIQKNTATVVLSKGTVLR